MGQKKMYDAVIIGGGPAGLSAAIYMARARYRTLVLEKENFGGQITITSEIVNYPGVKKESGQELTGKMLEQAKNFGAEFRKAEVLDLKKEGESWILNTNIGEISTLGVILAVGAKPRKIGFLGEEEWKGRGVAYCATCDGEFFSGREVFVIGGGYAAAEEALFLTRYAKKVRVMVRKKEMSCARSIVEKIENHPGIELHYETEIVSVTGTTFLDEVKFWNKTERKEVVYKAADGDFFGLFVFAGYEPATGWLKNRIQLEENGYIVTGKNQKTDREGVYAAGDVCVKSLRQVVTAVADGALAATALEKYLADLRESLGMERIPSEVECNFERKQEYAGKIKEEQEDGFFDADMKEQMSHFFEKFEHPVRVIGVLSEENALSESMDEFMKEITSFTDIVLYERKKSNDGFSYLEVQTDDKKETGIRFFGVPGGHEINSFLLALYNVAGPGKEITEELKNRIEKLPEFDMKIFVSLSCTMCPEVVTGAQKIAAIHSGIKAAMVDLQYHQEEKERYHILSVPCLVVNEREILFGKRSLEELVDFLEKQKSN